VLLTALVQTFSQWTGENSLLTELEDNGREGIFEDVDLSRTVGWFATRFPVLLDLEETSNLADALKSIKEQLRRIPSRGISYGLLRYLAADAEMAEMVRTIPQPEVSFSYLGQADQMVPESSLYSWAGEPSGLAQSVRGSRSSLFGVSGRIMADQLEMIWTYSEELHRRSTVERLAQGFMGSLRALIHHCQSAEAGGYTPSDFSKAKLNQKELDGLMAKLNRV
jgi:non-ribosomal peptide synthase protein (TIGR01720 family)